MNKLIISSLIAFTGLFIFSGAHAQNDRVIRDVVLLNVEPYEVLMTMNGDIVAKIRHMPDYLKSAELVPAKSIDPEILAEHDPSFDDVPPTELSQNQTTAPAQVKAPMTPEVIIAPGHYEVLFAKGTATLSADGLQTLNDLATELKSDPEKKVQLFGFRNESAMVASLLTKRRQDACISYLKIKGVHVDKQVLRGNVTEGTSNKIVFGFQ